MELNRMRMGIALLIVALGTSALAQNVNEKIKDSFPFLGGAGATRCAKWLEERDKQASILDFGLQGWILGFVSGANSGFSEVSNPGFLLDVKEEDVFIRIDFYCREHQSDILYQAALVVTADLMGIHRSRINKALKKQ